MGELLGTHGELLQGRHDAMTREMFQASVFTEITGMAHEDAFFLCIHDRSLQERFDFHEEHAQ